MGSLYKLKHLPMEKAAGTSIPNNPKQWPSEVLKALASQHNFIDVGKVKLKFDNVDPDARTASGLIIDRNKIAILFTIRPDEKTGKIELDPLDVMFAGGKFQHVTEDAYRRAVMDQPFGKPFDKDKDNYSKLPPGNEYVGDLTGDVTPLEYSGYPQAFAGSRGLTMAGAGLLSQVVRHSNELTVLNNLLTSYSGMGGAAEALGMRDSLSDLLGGFEEPSWEPRVAQVTRRADGQYFLSFASGQSRSVSALDLKELLADDFQSVNRQILRRGWAIVRDFPEVLACEAPALDTLPAPVEIGGFHRLITKDGQAVSGIVATQMVDFDGKPIKSQKVICSDGRFDIGKLFLGTRITESDASHPAGSSTLDIGKTGCFMDESFGNVMFTPNVTIQQIIEVPGQPPVIIATRSDTGLRIGLIPVSNLVKPMDVPIRHYDDYNLVPAQTFYIPAHMPWVEVSGHIELADQAKANTMRKLASDNRPVATLFENNGSYTLHGNLTNDQTVSERGMSEDEMRVKLAYYGADDYAIERACGLRNSTLELRGLIGEADAEEPMEKEAQWDDLTIKRAVGLIKQAAEDALEGADEALRSEGSGSMKEPKMLDAILSLQFVSDETLGELVESLPLFEEVEDRLAKMLMAARQGEETINEVGVQRALKGIGQARTSLRGLQVELQSREQG